MTLYIFFVLFVFYIKVTKKLENLLRKTNDYFIFKKKTLFIFFRKNLKLLFFERSNFLEHVLLKFAATFDDAFLAALLFQIHFYYIAQKLVEYAPISPCLLT